MITDDFEKRREIITKFAELGAMMLPVEEFMHIVFLNFHAEIEAELFTIAEQHQIEPKNEIWSIFEQAVDQCDFDHPILQAVFSNTLIRQLIGPEYTIFNRYPKVYEYLLRKKPAGEFNIAVIGCSYGQEIMSMLKCLHEEMAKNPDFSPKIDIFNKPTSIFQKVQTNIRYPESVLKKHLTPQQLAVDFTVDEHGSLHFSEAFYQRMGFYELDLFDVPHEPNSTKQYDLLMIHNVLQYLEPSEGQDISIFQQQAEAAFQWIVQQVKPSGMVSIINESKKPNDFVAELQDRIFNQHYACTIVKPAYLYTKQAI